MLPQIEEDPENALRKKLEFLGTEAHYEYIGDTMEDFSGGKFVCRIRVGEYTKIGCGNRRKNARNAAARAMLKNLEHLKPVSREEKDSLGIRHICGKSIDAFISTQKALLSQEEAACKALVKKPSKIKEEMVKYDVKDIESTKYGGTMVTFWNDIDGSHFKIGEGVKINGNCNEVFAIVTKVDKSEISLSVMESDWIFRKGQFGLEKLDGDKSFKEMNNALDNIGNTNIHNYALRDILCGLCEPSPAIDIGNDPIKFINKSLDDIQKQVVEFVMKQKELAVIHGPPGTGKTTTVTEVILQSVTRGQKVLVCAPSNVAVDNMLEMVKNNVTNKEDLVRIGHPARVEENLQGHTLDAFTNEIGKKVDLIKEELDDIQQDLEAGVDGMTSKREKQRTRMSYLEKELNIQEKQLSDAEVKILSEAKVIFGTLTCCGTESPLKLLPPNHFQLTVIDECAQALEAACWIAIPHASKLVLAGDHLQLPPTIHCKDKEVYEQLSYSLMEKLLDKHWYTIVKMLKVQYRMNSLIMGWSSETFYLSGLYAADSVCNHTLSQLEDVVKSELTDTVLLMIDTRECGMEESFSMDRASFANQGEAEIVCHQVNKLIDSGVRQKDIGVVTTYNLQVELLTSNLSEKYPEIEIKSVDGFQGREKEVVILTLVRSNTKRRLGFLKETRRLNVAVTRARRQLVVICDSETITNEPTLGKLVEYVKKVGTIKSPRQLHLNSKIKLQPSVSEEQPKQGLNNEMQHRRSVEGNIVLTSKDRVKDGKTFIGMAKNIMLNVDGAWVRETDLEMVIRLIKHKTEVDIPAADVEACQNLGPPGCGTYLICFSNKRPGSAWEALSTLITSGNLNMMKDNIFLYFHLNKTKADISFSLSTS